MATLNSLTLLTATSTHTKKQQKGNVLCLSMATGYANAPQNNTLRTLSTLLCRSDVTVLNFRSNHNALFSYFHYKVIRYCFTGVARFSGAQSRVITMVAAWTSLFGPTIFKPDERKNIFWILKNKVFLPWYLLLPPKNATFNINN